MMTSESNGGEPRRPTPEEMLATRRAQAERAARRREWLLVASAAGDWPWRAHLRGLIFGRFPSIRAFINHTQTTADPLHKTVLMRYLDGSRRPPPEYIRRVLAHLGATAADLIRATPAAPRPIGFQPGVTYPRRNVKKRKD